MVIKWSTQIKGILGGIRRQLGVNGPLLAGFLAGGIGLAISYALKGLVPARPLGDPIPLILAATSIPRGFTYFPWRSPLFHLLFAIFLGILTLLILRAILQRTPVSQEATRASRIAALINVGIVALLAVDAVVVGFWYAIAGATSILVTGFTAGFLASRWPR